MLYRSEVNIFTGFSAVLVAYVDMYDLKLYAQAYIYALMKCNIDVVNHKYYLLCSSS